MIFFNFFIFYLHIVKNNGKIRCSYIQKDLIILKYVFVTGGVVSGLGKGITAASLGRLLKARGYRVAAQKVDPYLNVDSGTINPYQHGEVFVTQDGAETDLDLGHYERFIDEDLNEYSHLTTGKIYWSVINKERNGEYLGKTVQIIPHITNEIKDQIYSASKISKADVVITEIGGTTGDIESQPFLEAIRQISLEVGKRNCVFVHVALVPYIESSGEQKSKPIQHSVKELRSIGIIPDIIVARCEMSLSNSMKQKISLFCNVKPDCVIENTTVSSLYAAPLMLENSNFSSIVCRELGLDYSNQLDLKEWQKMIERIGSLKDSVKIAIVGKYVNLHDAYLSVFEALRHGGYENSLKVEVKWVEAELVTKSAVDSLLKDCNGILVPGGFGNRGVEGKIVATEYARTHDVPFFGLCLGMQTALIEFARDVLGLDDATSTEFSEKTNNPVVHLMLPQKDVGKKGGTMRLGDKKCIFTPGSLISKLYGNEKFVNERHRHRYSFNLKYKKIFEKNGMVVSSFSEDGLVAESIEIPKNKFFVGVQYHPEFKSRPNKAHPLFRSFIRACRQ